MIRKDARSYGEVNCTEIKLPFPCLEEKKELKINFEMISLLTNIPIYFK